MARAKKVTSVIQPLTPRQLKVVAKTPQLMALVDACNLALRAGSHFGKHGTIANFNEIPITIRRWQEVFFDALDGVGVVYDRKKYYAGLESKKGKKK